VHKLLITELLKGGESYINFQKKQAKYEATLDCEEEGGVNIGEEAFDDEEAKEFKYKAIEPDDTREMPLSPTTAGPYPPLPSKGRSVSTISDITSSLDGISLNDDSGASTAINSPLLSPATTAIRANSLSASIRQVSSTQGSSTASGSRQPKVWGSRDGKSASSVLFSGVKPTPAPSEFSIAAYDDRVEQEHGLNIMKTRFWDPMSNDFNPERFYNAYNSKYYCPFICE
jgi:hypothetical protein